MTMNQSIDLKVRRPVPTHRHGNITAVHPVHSVHSVHTVHTINRNFNSEH